VHLGKADAVPFGRLLQGSEKGQNILDGLIEKGSGLRLALDQCFDREVMVDVKVYGLKAAFLDKGKGAVGVILFVPDGGQHTDLQHNKPLRVIDSARGLPFPCSYLYYKKLFPNVKAFVRIFLSIVAKRMGMCYNEFGVNLLDRRSQ